MTLYHALTIIFDIKKIVLKQKRYDGLGRVGSCWSWRDDRKRLRSQKSTHHIQLRKMDQRQNVRLITFRKYRFQWKCTSNWSFFLLLMLSGTQKNNGEHNIIDSLLKRLMQEKYYQLTAKVNIRSLVNLKRKKCVFGY